MSGTATVAPPEAHDPQSHEVPPQHMRALDQANRVRLARAELKRRVGVGDLTVADVLERSPWEAESMQLADLLMSQRRWGRTRCRKFLSSIQILENKMVGSLTERQRQAVVGRLTAGAEGPRPAGRRMGARPLR